jgi:Methyltransferase domain
MNDQTAHVAEAFSRKALLYDPFGEGHPNLERMRWKVRRHALATLRPGDRILELNAGTGADAVFFARLGFLVTANDISPGMIAQIEEKRARYRLGDRLTIQRCSFEEIGELPGGPFQYVFSNMGGVNCSGDLAAISRGLGSLLSPCSRVTWVVMPPVCLWELFLVLRGRFRAALRRLSPGGSLANVEGVQFRAFYYSPDQVLRAFGPDYHPVKLQGLSVFTPPADHKHFPFEHPRLYRLLCSLDERLSDHFPFNRCGDFYVLTLQYRGRGPRIPRI